MLGPQIRHVAKCDFCEMWARWRHLASELHVNRALRQPHEFLWWPVSDQYRRLQAHNRGHSLRVLDPAESFPAVALDWMQIPLNLMYCNSATIFGGTPYSPPKRLMREIKADTEATLGSARFWSDERMLD